MAPQSRVALLCTLFCSAAFITCGAEGEMQNLLLLLLGKQLTSCSVVIFEGSSTSLTLLLAICKSILKSLMQKLLIL